MDIVMLVIVASVYLRQATVVAKHIKVEESNVFASRKQ